MGKIIAFKPRVKSTADSRTADFRHLFKKVALPQMALLMEDEVEDAIKTCDTGAGDLQELSALSFRTATDK